jgi:DNA-binding MarR family transcriptional regulator
MPKIERKIKIKQPGAQKEVVKMKTRETSVIPEGYGELWAMVNQVYWAMIRVTENELRPTGITMIQAAVLFLVKNAKTPATPAQLSRWLFREPHTVSGLLNRMEKQGLIRKTKDLERKNLVRVTLTEKGEKAYQQQSEMRVIRKLLSSLSPKQRNNFMTSLRILRSRALDELVVRRQLPFP